MRTVHKTCQKKQPVMEETNASPIRNVGIPPFNVTHGQVNFRECRVVDNGEYERNSCIQIFESLWSFCSLAD